MLLVHEAEPVAVAEDGHDGVETIKTGRERNLFVDIEATAHRIDYQPQEPLLDPLLRQCPHGHHAERGGEGIKDRHGAVSESDEYPPDACQSPARSRT